MKKLSLEHSEAVSAAKASLIRQADSATTPRYRAVLERQVELMTQVYWWVLHGIYNPGLPFNEETLAEDIEQLHKDHNHGPETKPD